jgi:hypothetical protein
MGADGSASVSRPHVQLKETYGQQSPQRCFGLGTSSHRASLSMTFRVHFLACARPCNVGLPSPNHEGNCTGSVGEQCCYMQHASDIKDSSPRTNFTCWEKPLPSGSAKFVIGTATTAFAHFWETGINSPHSALTLRSDYQAQMTDLHHRIGCAT